MGIDPDRIERTDFSTAWRGYDRAEVDAHLREIAAAVEALRRRLDSSTRAGSLSAAADERLRPILDAAEASAGEIRSEAEDEARRLVGRVEERTSDLLGRADSLDSELDDLVSRMRTAAATAAESLRRDVLAMQGELEQLPGGKPSLPAGSEAREEPGVEAEGPREGLETEREGAIEGSVGGPEPPFSTRAEDAVPARASAATEAAGEEDDQREEPPPATPRPARPPTEADLEGARLIAMNMALGGSPREETADYLRQTFGLDDSALLDDVYERARAS
jgi:DivIVA domain-containing protein